MKRSNFKNGGFTLVEIMIVVALIGLLASIAVPNWVKARTVSQENACINNLRQIDGAKQQWAIEFKKANTILPTYADIEPLLKNDVTCPSGNRGATFDDTYDMGIVGVKPTCKIVPLKHVMPSE